MLVIMLKAHHSADISVFNISTLLFFNGVTAYSYSESLPKMKTFSDKNIISGGIVNFLIEHI